MMPEGLKSLLREALILSRIIDRPDFKFRLVKEHPIAEEIEKGVIYVVGGKRFQKWAYFRCPTDLNEIIQLSLMQKHRPRWSIKLDWLSRPTIHPSVRQTEGSFAHFWIRRGQIELCSDSGRAPRNDKRA